MSQQARTNPDSPENQRQSRENDADIARLRQWCCPHCGGSFYRTSPHGRLHTCPDEEETE